MTRRAWRIRASLAMASVILAPWAALDLPARAPSAGAVGAVVVLGLLCTAIGFVVYAILIREAGTSRATVITFVNPVVAVALGVLLLGHPVRRRCSLWRLNRGAGFSWWIWGLASLG